MLRGEVGVEVMMDQCQRTVVGRGIPDQWKTIVIVAMFKEKGNKMSCG